MLKDHLGSASVVTDSTGNIVGEQRYYPFGETRLSAGTLYTDKLFTGQRNIAGLGIYHYQSRFYSPKLGRFLSADSLVPNPFNPQDYNRYSYVRNNPVRYTDPSGHRVCVTQEECADMGTTPNGGRNLPKPKKIPGGGNDRDRGGDDAIPDPNPNGLPSPIPERSKDDGALLTPTTTTTPETITTPTPTGTPPPFRQSSTDPDIDVAKLAGGSILILAGISFIALGVTLIIIATGETAVVTLIPSPFDDLMTLGHRVQAVAIGLALFIPIGVTAIAVGYREVKDAVTP